MRISDWSSDVCSSDLARRANPGRTAADAQLWAVDPASAAFDDADELVGDPAVIGERRMGVAAAEIEAREVQRRDAVGQSGPQHCRDRCDLGKEEVRSHQGEARPRLPRGECGAKTGRSVGAARSEEHTSELQSLMRISYAVFCLNT